MLTLKTFLASLLAAILALFGQQAPTPNTPTATPSSQVKATCNPKLWDHVWNPWRLKVIEDCKTVEGTIEKQFLAEDGDYHLILGPDNLVLEIICAGPIEPDVKVAQKACKGYENKVVVPEVGDHVRVTGSYVLDTTHSWNEIHPVSVIEKLP